jgi:hypothetical protein
MASIISAGTTSGTALNMSGDTSGALQLATNGTTTAMTINTSQQVGVGVTSSTWSNGKAIEVSNAGSAIWGGPSLTAITSGYTYNSGDKYAVTGGYALQFQMNYSNGAYIWYSTSTTGTAGNAATVVQRMTLDYSGNLLIGQTTGNADARTSINGGSTDSSPCIDYVKNSATTTTAQVYARFTANAVGTGSITANGAAAAAFTAWSDRRLKENITDLPSQLANIMALRPVEFDYVESMGGGHQIGFIAQDVQAIYPDLVGESSDGMLTLTDMNKNDARLIKAIQELKAINDTQAETITALTARIVALETV